MKTRFVGKINISMLNELKEELKTEIFLTSFQSRNDGLPYEDHNLKLKFPRHMYPIQFHIFIIVTVPRDLFPSKS